MQDNTNNRASFRITADSVTVEGGEEFVERLIEKLGLEALVEQLDLSSISSRTSQARKPEIEPDGARLLPPPCSNGSPVFSELDEVYAENGENFSIIADVDENTIAKTARNYILLYLYGAYLSDQTEVSDDDLRAVCTAHACYDPGNFAHHVKGLGSKVVRIGTSARSYKLKLTAPGIRAAKQFAAETQKRAMGQ